MAGPLLFAIALLACALWLLGAAASIPALVMVFGAMALAILGFAAWASLHGEEK